MKTAQEAINRLSQAIKEAQEAEAIVKDLIAPHDYQDVATLATQSAINLLRTARAFMENSDGEALEILDNAEDLIEGIYDIIDGDIDD